MLPFPSFLIHILSIWCILSYLTAIFITLVQFNTLSDKILIKFLGKLLDEATEELGWLMYKNKGKMF